MSRSPWQSTLMPKPAPCRPKDRFTGMTRDRPKAARCEDQCFPGFPSEDAPQDVAGGRPSAEPPVPSAARATRDRPSMGAGTHRQEERVLTDTVPRMPTDRSGSQPEGVIRMRLPKKHRRKPADLRPPSGTRTGKSRRSSAVRPGPWVRSAEHLSPRRSSSGEPPAAGKPQPRAFQHIAPAKPANRNERLAPAFLEPVPRPAPDSNCRPSRPGKHGIRRVRPLFTPKRYPANRTRYRGWRERCIAQDQCPRIPILCPRKNDDFVNFIVY